MDDPTPPVLAYGRRGRRPFPHRAVAVTAFTLPVLLLWAGSYWRDDAASRTSSAGDFYVKSDSGGLYAYVEPPDRPLPPGATEEPVRYGRWTGSAHGPWEPIWQQPVRRWAGFQSFQMHWYTQSGRVTITVVVISHWVLALMATALGWATGRWVPPLAVVLMRAARRELTVWTSKSG